MRSIKDFWVPRKKYALVNELSKIHPEKRPQFEKMTKEQLYAIWYSICRKNQETTPSPGVEVDKGLAAQNDFIVDIMRKTQRYEDHIKTLRSLIFRYVGISRMQDMDKARFGETAEVN